MSAGWMSSIGALIIGAPLVSLISIVIDRVFRREVREIFIKRCLVVSQIISIGAGIACSLYVILTGVPLELGSLRLVSLSTQDLAFSLRMDGISVSFVLISCLLGGIVGIFASRYLHRDPGYFRFFILYHIFLISAARSRKGGGWYGSAVSVCKWTSRTLITAPFVRFYRK